MKKIDYIIVGLGIAGLSFSRTLAKQGKTFIVIDSGIKSATKASGGVLNPTVLKRFTAAWDAQKFITKAFPFYTELEVLLKQKIIHQRPIHRILASIEEQNNWMLASDKESLKSFLTSEILVNENKAINAPFGLGKVLNGATINPSQLLQCFQKYLEDANQFITETFCHKELKIIENAVIYKGYTANKIVFAEGVGVVDNPYFTLAISPKAPKIFVANKGEYILVKAPKLKSNAVLKGPVMLIPLGHDLYKVGASYGRDDFSTNTTNEACFEISEKLKKMISCNFEVVDQVTGIRPTVKDRKPLLGSLTKNNTVAFLNGLGTRGIMMAPLLSEHLYNYLENNIPLPVEIDIKRFL